MEYESPTLTGHLIAMGPQVKADQPGGCKTCY